METSLAGKLLVATPDLTDDLFARSVVLVLQHDEDTAEGVILNKPLDTPVDDVLPGWQQGSSRPQRVFQGGPVKTDSAVGLVGVPGDSEPPAGVKRLFGAISLVDLDSPQEIIWPQVSALRIFAGYAGWGPGQLEDELAEARAGGSASPTSPSSPSDPADPSPDGGSGRVLDAQDLADVVASRTQPPFPASAMDGYALRGAELAAEGETRLRIARLDRERNLPRRLWSMLWNLRQERHRRAALRAADGIQMNGFPADRDYAGLNPLPLRYLDNRMTLDMMAAPADMQARRDRHARGEPLRLIHSGRLEPMKGGHLLVPLARALQAAASSVPSATVPSTSHRSGRPSGVGALRRTVAAVRSPSAGTRSSSRSGSTPPASAPPTARWRRSRTPARTTSARSRRPAASTCRSSASARRATSASTSRALRWIRAPAPWSWPRARGRTTPASSATPTAR